MARVQRIAESRTESLLRDLLIERNWSPQKPPRGDLLIKQEYLDFPDIATQFRSKTGSMGGFPEGVLVKKDSIEPLAVIEAKASVQDIKKALKEAEMYASACVDAGHLPVAIGIAGDEEEAAILVSYWDGQNWQSVTYENNPITWIPTLSDITYIQTRISEGNPVDLRPSVPPPAVLNKKADEINRLLRESKLKDEYRPGAVAAIMLGLWQSKGNIRRDPEFILRDINGACETAFQNAGKPNLANSLKVDPANATLAVKARRICKILESLNVTVLTAEHDYLGQLYEAFFRYTGGNTIGQYFTPRHITSLATELTKVTSRDIVLDPAVGSGGFLIAAMNRVIREEKLSREDVIDLVHDQLIGFETEPMTASLAVANMILRGDGTTGIFQADCFQSDKYPINRANVVLMNPPFPHQESDTPPELFINRGLEALTQKGLMAVIVPNSLLVKKDKKPWRSKVLRQNSLRAVISLPSELFQPYASATTSMLIIEKGVPNEDVTYFARLENDGFKIRKGIRQPIQGSQIPEVLSGFRNGIESENLSGLAKVENDKGWAPGFYIPYASHSPEELRAEVDFLIRSKLAFVVQHGQELSSMMSMIEAGTLETSPYTEMVSDARRRAQVQTNEQTIGGLFEIYYGQKSLHNKSGLVSGNSLIISSSGGDNGCYGFFDFTDLIEPSFVTVPSTGSIGEARVQEFPCGVTDDCLLLIPKKGVTRSELYAAAAAVRLERWRFDYGRKMTPDRIRDLPVSDNTELLEWTNERLTNSKKVEQTAIDLLN